MITLEQILHTHFGCRKPFLKTPKRLHGGEYTEFFTHKGGKAYDKLCTLLENLEELGILRGSAAAIEQLDSIVRNEN